MTKTKTKTKNFPRIDPILVEILETIYPKLEYSQDTTQEQWAFRGGQRDVLQKLRNVLNLQIKEMTNG